MKRIDRNVAFHALRKDQRHMDTWFREFFDDEVAKDGFMSGGVSFVVVHEKASYMCDIAAACLDRANYDVFRTTPIEIHRRVAGIENLSDEDVDKAWLDADCYIIQGMFDDIALTGLSASEKATVAWFVKEAVTYGNVVIIPVDNPDDHDLDSYGVELGNFIEKTFERVDGKSNQIKKRKGNGGA